MFDRLKNIFRKRAAEEQVEEPPQSVFPPSEFQTGYTPGARPTTAPPRPQPAPPPAARVEEVDEELEQPASGDSVRLLLKPVLLKLSDALKTRVRLPPAGNVSISIPLQKVLTQLPQGSVKISFGELRLASPAGVFTEASDQDQTLIELPLPEILAQLKPDQLPRRATQKRVEVPDEVTGLFGAKGASLTDVRMSSATAKAPTAPAQTSPIAPRQTTPAAAPYPAAPIKPISPLSPPSIKPTSPLPAPAALKPQAPFTVPAPAIKPSQPLPSPTALKVPAAAPVAPVAQRVAAPLEPLIIPLAQLSGAWPEALKQAAAELSNATLALPADEIEQALKRGKILFPWKRIRSLIKPALPPPADQSQDDIQLELPLSVIAPLFLAQKKPTGQQKKYTITEDIPDVFTGKGMVASPQAQVAESFTPAAPAAPAVPPIAMPTPPAPVRPTVAPAAPAAFVTAAPSSPQEIGQVFGQPGRKNWTPSEIAQKTSALKGVAGALIAMQDGLLVAGHLPPGLNPETISAFLPQMFSRVMQYSKELKFGEANNLTVIVDNVPLKIFKAGGVFFTVLGRAGESLPEPHLSIIAAHLGPQNK